MRELKENYYQTQASRVTLARALARESMVLLKNEEKCLPLGAGTAAFFGRACYQPNLGGMGSGMSFMGKEVPTIFGACEEAGLIPEPQLHSFYTDIFDQEEPFDPYKELMEAGTDLVASGIIYDIFGRYHTQAQENAVPEELLQKVAENTDTAVLVIGRNTGGEECDRRVVDDYYLLDSEKKLVADVCRVFPKVVVLLNINGVTDISWVDKYDSIKAVLYIGTAGEQGPAAMADILTGKVTPSGKLAFTIAFSYEEYSTADTFSYNKDLPDSILEYKDYGLDGLANGSIGFEKSPVTVYREGLYMGYRYFDSFGKDVLYPFGFGLSYAEFGIEDLNAGLEFNAIKDMRLKGTADCFVSARVKNLSDCYSGKEVVQIYVSPPQGRLEKPYQTYAGCAKTSLLQPGEQETVIIYFSPTEMASYDEAQAAWILEPGKYYVRAGSSSRNTHIAGSFLVEEAIICEQPGNALSLQEVNMDKIEFISPNECPPITYDGESEEKKAASVIVLNAENILNKNEAGKVECMRNECGAAAIAAEEQGNVKSGSYRLLDVKKGNVTMAGFLSQLSTEELMALAVGYGPGLPFGGMGMQRPCTIQNEDGTDITFNTHKSGNKGYVSPAIPKYGITSAFYKDGPAGVGMTAWPTGMTLACCFNTELFYAFGSACAYEALKQDVDSWLAPALNLHRNPIGGRNFEYFSEDPYAAGICGVYICRGAQETTGVTCCPKHLALNEQETYRRGSTRKSIDAVDTIVTERTIRELYLKPFEMVIKNTRVTTLMTSFNKINGTFAGGSHDLCTKILREEWGYQGVVVTDWGDMDIVVDGADAVAAGNDVIMPGGPPVIRQIRKGYEEGRVNREQLEEAVSHLLYFVMNALSFD